MNTHSIRIKAIVLSIVFTMCVLVVPCIKASADSFPSAFYVNGNSFYSAAQIYVAYNELNAEQRDIANYLLGMYNLFYFGSRGFQFKQGAYSSQSSFIAKIKSYGYRLFYNASGVALQSRMDDNFLKYTSAVLLYASQCNTTFDTWFSNLDEDFTIPVDQGILNSFTLLYQDNSDMGIETYGDVQTPWKSGVVNPYWFAEYSFLNATEENRFNDFLNAYNPVLISNRYNFYGTNDSCMMVSLKNKVYPNAVFILRGDTYRYFKYGLVTVNGNSISLNTNYDHAYNYMICTLRSDDTVQVGVSDDSNMMPDITREVSQTSDLSTFIDRIFNNSSPIYRDSRVWNHAFDGAYPFIGHVFLVDNLSTLSNPTEIFNSDSYDIVGLTGDMIVPVDNVDFKPKALTTINLPDNTQNNVSIRDLIDDDNVVDDDGNPVDPWQLNIIIQPNETNPISIDVNMFTGGKVYLEYLWEHTRKMVVFAKDLLDCFEFEASDGGTYGPKYAIYGVLVLGVAGGMIAKFLL